MRKPPGSRILMLGLASCLLLASALTTEPSCRLASVSRRPVDLGIDPQLGILNIDHVIFIVQENRSFDSYFGTFPGADGIPQGVCLPIRRCNGVITRITTRTSSIAGGRTTSGRRGSPSTRGRWTARSRRFE
jgi:phospholipase C